MEVNRYKEIVLKETEDIVFETLEETEGRLVIIPINITKTKLKVKPKPKTEVKPEAESKVKPKTEVKPETKSESKLTVYSENYANPPIPEGYKRFCGDWNEGFVIKRGSDGSQFVWIPVGYLDPNGTLDGFSFTEKFGRRNYMHDKFSEEDFYETLTDELALQIESVKKYGGFYISRYNISKSLEGKPQSVKEVMPWVNIDFNDAKEVASTIENNETVKSHLTFGAEYDSVLEWFIKSNARTRSEIIEDSTNWGNYWNEQYSCKKICEVKHTNKWCTNNIYDFAGNVNEWTQEKYGEYSFCVIRGGNFGSNGDQEPVAYREYENHFKIFGCTGFRATLCIK